MLEKCMEKLLKRGVETEVMAYFTKEGKLIFSVRNRLVGGKDPWGITYHDNYRKMIGRLRELIEWTNP